MPKLGMEPVRRRQAIEATMACIHQDGVGQASLQRIAQHAGMTSGLILHYFGDKDGLFEAVYRDLYQRLGAGTLARLKLARTPVERLFAVLEAQVCDEMVEPQTVATWFAIAARAQVTPMLARMERINSKRLTSNLVHTLKLVGLSHEDAQDISAELLALIYGIWSNLANGAISNPAEARIVMYRFAKARVPQLSGGPVEIIQNRRNGPCATSDVA